MPAASVPGASGSRAPRSRAPESGAPESRAPETSAHDDAIREQFRLQAATWSDDRRFATAGLDWIVERLAPQPGDQVLDVAAGAGHIGRALAPHVRSVAAIDLTPEMLDQGQRLAAAEGLRNIAFQLGNATALPWLDGQFDLVACRFTVHQVADPGAVVREMVRVARGRIAIIDMIADDDPAVAAETNRLERLRDPSHNRTHTLGELRDLLAGAGATVTGTAGRDNPLELEDWLERTQAPAAVRAEIRDRFAAELDGGAPTGLRPVRGPDGTVSFIHTWAAVLADR
jgi:2-polyprenyl-3-methyl-5-hydroxy-6-metoxy-1,4-benzoquinol methylase